MINIKELRIGNNVSYVGCVSWVNGIYLSHFTVYDNNMIQRNSAQDNIQPILLTPEILAACGFVKHSGSGVGILTIAYEDTNSPCTLQRTGDGIQVCRSGIGAITAQIDSLHQLQNLYFTLTGKELAYSPK